MTIVSDTSWDVGAPFIPSIATAPIIPDGTRGSVDRQELRSTKKLRPLSVLHVINGEHFSGAERVQQLLGKRLPDYDVETDFLCLKAGKFPSLCDLRPDSLFTIPMKNRWDLSTISRVSNIVRAGQYDLLHAHTPRSALITGFVARRMRIPWVYHVHSPASRDSTRLWINQINHWIERWSLRGCSQIVTVSDSLKKDLLSQGWNPAKIATVPNGVAKQLPIDCLDKINSKSWRFGMIALFRPRKGLEVLLEAIKNLPVTAPKIEVNLIGGFETLEYESAMHSLVDQLQLRSRIHFTGFTADVTSEIRKLDALVLPSLFGEGMPMVVLEALSSGVPVVATRVEGTPEIVRDGIEGFLAEPKNPESLAQAMLRMTECRIQWSEMSQLAMNRHRTCFSDSQMARKLSSLYRQLLSSNLSGCR